MTPDIALLRKNLGQLSNIMDTIQLTLIDNSDWEQFLNDNYFFNVKNCTDPDIIDNTKAMRETNRLISWFGQDHEGYVGLWRGPNEIPLEKAQIVRLDTEGEYALVADTVPNYLVMTYFYGDEDADKTEFNRVRQLLVKAGFTVAADIEAIWDHIDYNSVQPNDYRNKLYNQARALRGLPPVE
ncbi:hypothetical protein SOASR030_17900 [Leminorella grimontii]|uniref:Uncharacterized protein n=1 Tax=Leminorella grimontii TaxID=82981 RepID=A0AAV5N0P9_9GAMM|nr:hypothetical protein [Leminorella grimontii]KFC93624.1 hypothetical protein GLGR_3188 [Leminorella grimontii ATCC 33999 = DSM 5078]GKX55678.1 hypothetical protein SOASR030_17900 [Leminorella grimontii]VFS55380.1 Uncharacterised protein [Leminorella grimontii]